MPRNFSRLVMVLGAAFLAGAPALHAQSGAQPVRGDVDGDGRVTAADARIVSDFLVGKPVPPGMNVRERGDVNGDGRVTSVDAAIIARAAAGRDVSRFPVGQALPESALAVVECVADVGAGTVSCGMPGMAGGARADIIGGQGLNVQLTSTNVVRTYADSTFTFDVTVQNLMKQAMAADSGTGAPSANGVRVFFAAGPTMTDTAGTGTPSQMHVINFDGKGYFTGTGPGGLGQPYFQYSGTDLGGDGILSRQETSAARNWKLHFDPGVKKFNFTLYLSTALQYPAGWIDIEPPVGHNPRPDSVPADTVVAGRSLQLTAIVRNNRGNVLGGPVTWSDTNHGFADVNASGLVTTTVGANGVDSVRADQGVRSGAVEIVVTAPSGPNSVITATPTTMTAGLDSSVITVQVKDGFGRNVTSGGDVVTLTTSLDSLVAATDTGMTVTPVYVGNGIYRAKLIGRTAGSALVTGTVNGGAIGTTATVTVNAAAPALITKTSTDPQNGTVGNTVGSLPAVHVTDTYGNAVAAGFPVKFKVTGGGGKVANGGAPADSVVINTSGSGNAALTSWTLGSVAPLPNQLTVSVAGGSNPSTTFTAYVPPVVLSDSSEAMGNANLGSSVTPKVLLNDAGFNGTPLSFVTPTEAGQATEAGGSLTLHADGSFDYVPPPPAVNALRDSMLYTVGDGHINASAYIKIRFVGRVWFVDSGNGGAADGRQNTPFTSVGAAATAAGTNESILVKTGSGPTGGGTLKNGQLVHGQGNPTAFSTTLNTFPVTLLAAGTPATAPNIGALTLGSGNTLRGFTSSGGISSSGPGFVTLTVSDVAINNPAGQALNLTNGTLSGGFISVTSGGGTNNVALSSVTLSGGVSLGSGALSGASGSALLITSGISAGASDVLSYSGSITNATVNATVAVVGGNPRLLLTGNVSQTGSGAAVSASGGHTGTLTFSTGTVSASNGTGLQFNNADGSYAFNGTTTLNGGDAGVDVLAGSGGTFSFAAGASITNPSGAALFVDASAPTLTYAGSISTGPASGRPVHVQGMTGGSVDVSGAVSSTGQGILVQNNTGGSTTFSGNKTLNTGTNAAVTLATNAGHPVAFTTGNLAVTTTSGTGFAATGSGSFTVTGSGNNISTGSGAAISLANVTVGAAGMVLGTVSSTGATNAVSLTNVIGPGTITSTGGTLTGVAAGAPFLVSGGNANVTWGGGITQGANNALLSVSGGHTGTLAFNTGTVSASSGTGLQFDNADGSYDFGSSPNLLLAGGDAGIDVLNGSGGTFTFASSAFVNNPTGEAIRINASSPTFTYPGRITKNGTTGITVSNNTSGTISFGSRAKTITSTGGNVAVNLATNGTATITSADSLAITSATGNGYNATGGGTVAVTGANNTINSVGGIALNVSSTTIGVGGLNFRSISANGGTNGIVLNGTGNTAGLTVTGTGSTANSGGIVQNTSGDAIQATSATSVSLSLMSIQPDASGVMLTNVSGTSSLSRSTVDYLGTAPGGAYAFRMANTSTNATLTLDGTTFQNKMDGTTSVSVSALGTSVITFNAIDSNTGDAFPSRYQNLFGSGIVVGSGDNVGSTANVTANISNTAFQNAPSNGLNNLELGVTQNATLVPNITTNTFDKVALPLATVGVINLNATVMGRVGSNTASGIISGNTITNIRSGAGPTFAYSAAGTNGYVGIRVAIDNDAGGVNHKLQILNNSITEVARQGLLVSARGAANNVNVRIQGNTIGTAANPVGTASARRGVEIEAQTTATLKVEVVNNPSIVGGTSAANSALHLRAGVNAGATSTVNATITGNTVGNPDGATNVGRFRAETVSGNNGTFCLDLRNNVLESAAKEFQTNNNGGTYNRNASGNTGTITTVGAVGAVASCPTPSF